MLNHITIMGRLVRDPELRRTASGLACASFTVAVDRDRAPEGQEKETDFIDCVAWRGTGEFVSKYFSKGSMIAVSGRLQIRGWTDKEGNKRRTAEIVADNCYFCGDKRSADTAPAYSPTPDPVEQNPTPQGGGSWSERAYNAMKNGDPYDQYMQEGFDHSSLPF